MKEFVSAVVAAEGSEDDEDVIEFKLDGRVMRAYRPHAGQLTFLSAAMGRGQTNDARFASIINLMLSSLRDEDADYFESRLLTRKASDRLRMEQVEEIFEFLMSEWFDRPTQSSSDSAVS